MSTSMSHSDSQGPSDEQHVSTQQQAITAHIRALNRHDWEALGADFVNDGRAFCDVMSQCKRYAGIAGIKEFYTSFHKMSSDFKFEVMAMYHPPEVSAAEIFLSGTHDGADYEGIPASGRKFTLELAIVYVFGTGAEAGKLVGERLWFDDETLRRQLRGEPNAPKRFGLREYIKAEVAAENKHKATDPTSAQRCTMQHATLIEHEAGENIIINGLKDWDRTYNTFVKDERAHYDVIPIPKRYEGHAGVVEWYSSQVQVSSDFTYVAHRIFHSPRVSFVEVTVTGTHDGIEVEGIPASGRKYQIEMFAFYLFGHGHEADKLMAERIYYDNNTYMVNMRGRKKLLGLGELVAKNRAYA
jgi:predicted ester cyclase